MIFPVVLPNAARLNVPINAALQEVSTFENAALVRESAHVYPRVFFENSKLNEPRYFNGSFKRLIQTRRVYIFSLFPAVCTGKPLQFSKREASRRAYFFTAFRPSGVALYIVTGFRFTKRFSTVR